MDQKRLPIKDAEILWHGDGRSVRSRSDGRFRLEIPVRAEVVILVRRPGYTAQSLRIDLRTASYWSGEIVLAAGSTRLADLEVTARLAKPAAYASTNRYDDFFRRKRMGIGTFISRERIEQLNAFHTIEILRGIPGIYVNIGNAGDPGSAAIRIPRCGREGKVTVWIDGQRLIEGRGTGQHGGQSFQVAEMLGRITPTGIEMVEVYRGPSQIPGEFHWDGCAAIVIWTRDGISRP